MTKAVLFDMDGVLIDSFEAWFSVFNSALRYFGFKEISKEEFTKNCWAIDSKIVVPNYFPSKSITTIIDYYFQHFFDFTNKIKVLPDSKTILKELKNMGIKTAIVTNTYRKQTVNMLKRISLFDLVNTVVCADDVKAGKPEPDMLLKACENLKVKKEDVVFVGDTKLDMLAGKKAGIFSIGLNVGGGNNKIKSLKEVLVIFENIK